MSACICFELVKVFNIHCVIKRQPLSSILILQFLVLHRQSLNDSSKTSLETKKSTEIRVFFVRRVGAEESFRSSDAVVFLGCSLLMDSFAVNYPPARPTYFCR